MKRLTFIIWLVLLALLGGCQVQDAYSGKIILNGSHALAAGSTLDGDLIVLGGAFTQQPGAAITGAVHVYGGQVELGGPVAGGVTLLSGDLTLAEGAGLRGDLNALGGELTVSPLARISGRSTVRPPGGQPDPLAPVPRFVRLLLELPPLLLVAYLGARFYPAQVGVIRRTLAAHPWVCAATGLLAMVAGLSLAIMMAYTVLLLPASFFLLVLMLFAATFGALPAAVVLGNWLADRLFSFPLPLVRSTLLGMALLVVLAELTSLIPLAGDLIILTLLLTALGAALLTHLGARLFVPAGEHPPYGD